MRTAPFGPQTLACLSGERGLHILPCLVCGLLHCFVTVTACVCLCHRLCLSVLPARSVRITGRVCPCHRSCLSVSPARSVHVIGRVCPCHWSCLSMSLVVSVYVTSQVCLCHRLCLSVSPAMSGSLGTCQPAHASTSDLQCTRQLAWVSLLAVRLFIHLYIKHVSSPRAGACHVTLL